MKEIIRLIIQNITTLFLILLGLHVQAQDGYVTTADTTVLSVERLVPQAKIDAYRAKPAYNYDEKPEYSDNILAGLWMRIGHWLEKMLGGGSYGLLGKFIYYGFIFLALIMVVIFVSKVQGHNPFSRSGRKSETALAAELVNEKSSIESIERLIEKAESSSEYRLAIRLHYLKSLKLLDTATIITWRSGKTNHDYLLEIQDSQLKEEFDDLNYIYEYSWYGQFAIDDEAQYSQLSETYLTFYENISK